MSILKSSVLRNSFVSFTCRFTFPQAASASYNRHQSTYMRRLVYSEFGDPGSVLKYEEVETGNPMDKLVVKMMASPINPADINTIQGTYPIKPKEFPAVGGMEGVGVVVTLGHGPNPNNLSEGDWVIPRHPGSGTWRNRIYADNDDFIPIPKIELVSAATLSVNPCTAYRLLKDFGELEPGNTVIQNGGNSSVGRGVIQLCREFGFKSISIVRDREGIAELKTELESLGDVNTLILTEEELRPKVKQLRAKLALNCIGGKVATEMLRTLEPGGIMVTYGGMARQPVIVPTSQLIFNGVALHGFWMTRWNHVNPLSKRLEMLNYLAQLCTTGKFTPPRHKLIPISDYKEAFTNSTGFTNTKLVFTFD